MKQEKIITSLDKLTVRFAGDSGDGIQLMGKNFASMSGKAGYDFRSFADFPAEIRAPSGSIDGISAFQIQFGGERVMTAGDRYEILFAFNAAALRAHIDGLVYGGLIIADSDNFKRRDYEKAGYSSSQIESSLLDSDAMANYRVLPIAITQQTLSVVNKDYGLSYSQRCRARNFWALGLSLWLLGRTEEGFITIAKKNAGSDLKIQKANFAALRAGHAFGETMELQFEKSVPKTKATQQKGNYKTASGIDAMVNGLLAVSALAQLKIVYCSYPITPASRLLHELSALNGMGVMVFQFEDEIAAVSAALGASFAGSLGVTATSGPGMSLMSEILGLAVASELPLLVIDIQRSGPSTGMPTKTEQSDLHIALYGRHGEAPCVVLAPATVAQCYQSMIDAAKIAINYMLPVIILADAFLANCLQPWLLPKIDKSAAFSLNKAENKCEIEKRDENNLARKWIKPGQELPIYVTGGLERKIDGSEISYDADNHIEMVKIRQEKVKRAQNSLPPAVISQGEMSSEMSSEMSGEMSGEMLLIGWGSSFGALATATEELIEEGYKVAHCHIYSLSPLPAGLDLIIKKFAKIMIVESNNGQLYHLIRSKFLVDAIAYGSASGGVIKVEKIKNHVIYCLKSDILLGE